MPTAKVGPMRRSPASCASWAMICGHSQSVPRSPVGPCCSLEPMGMTIVRDLASRASISGQVEKARSMASA